MTNICRYCKKRIHDISMDMGFIWVHSDSMKMECDDNKHRAELFYDGS